MEPNHDINGALQRVTHFDAEMQLASYQVLPVVTCDFKHTCVYICPLFSSSLFIPPIPGIFLVRVNKRKSGKFPPFDPKQRSRFLFFFLFFPLYQISSKAVIFLFNSLFLTTLCLSVRIYIFTPSLAKECEKTANEQDTFITFS